MKTQIKQSGKVEAQIPLAQLRKLLCNLRISEKSYKRHSSEFNMGWTDCINTILKKLHKKYTGAVCKKGFVITYYHDDIKRFAEPSMSGLFFSVHRSKANVFPSKAAARKWFKDRSGIFTIEYSIEPAK